MINGDRLSHYFHLRGEVCAGQKKISYPLSTEHSQFYCDNLFLAISHCSHCSWISWYSATVHGQRVLLHTCSNGHTIGKQEHDVARCMTNVFWLFLSPTLELIKHESVRRLRQNVTQIGCLPPRPQQTTHPSPHILNERILRKKETVRSRSERRWLIAPDHHKIFSGCAPARVCVCVCMQSRTSKRWPSPPLCNYSLLGPAPCSPHRSASSHLTRCPFHWTMDKGALEI